MSYQYTTEFDVVKPLKPNLYKRYIDDIYSKRIENQPDKLFENFFYNKSKLQITPYFALFYLYFFILLTWIDEVLSPVAKHKHCSLPDLRSPSLAVLFFVNLQTLTIFWTVAFDKRRNPSDPDFFKTSSGRLWKIPTSCYQTRRRHDVWKKCRVFDFSTSWRRPINVVLKTSNLRCLEDVWFTTSWRRLIYDVLMTSNLRLLGDVFKAFDLQPLEDVWFTSS